MLKTAKQIVSLTHVNICSQDRVVQTRFIVLPLSRIHFLLLTSLQMPCSDQHFRGTCNSAYQPNDFSANPITLEMHAVVALRCNEGNLLHINERKRISAVLKENLDVFKENGEPLLLFFVYNQSSF